MPGSELSGWHLTRSNKAAAQKLQRPSSSLTAARRASEDLGRRVFGRAPVDHKSCKPLHRRPRLRLDLEADFRADFFLGATLRPRAFFGFATTRFLAARFGFARLAGALRAAALGFALVFRGEAANGGSTGGGTVSSVTRGTSVRLPNWFAKYLAKGSR